MPCGSNSFGDQSYGFTGFTGLEHDESGLVYARNRYYSPGLGRFISEDPIGFSGGSNFYAYCGNDPINFTDPLGLYQTGSYLGDVGQIFAGYGDALIPVNAVNGMIGLGGVAYRCGLGAAASMAGKGLMDMFMGLGSDDPRAFGNSLMGSMMTLAPGLKKVPTPKYFPKLPKFPRKGAAAAAATAAVEATEGKCFVAGTLVLMAD
ncbi:MAG: RHS repeat-associated core domain-containing protein, partial [Armatimonadetes bacterium]|nr:RHS repeat-associated core domain-containing protein [Armatimonadota bacterium]